MTIGARLLGAEIMHQIKRKLNRRYGVHKL